MTMFRISRRFLIGAVVLAPSMALAQPPGPRDGDPRPSRGDRDRPVGDRPVPLILAALDTNNDGELSEKEIRNASEALGKLDHNHDGILDRSEIQPRPDGPRRGGREGGPRPEGRPRGDREGGPRPEGVPRDRGGPRPEGGPRDGRGPGLVRVLPPFAREELSLTEAQEDKIASLEKDVTDKLEAILTPDQMRELDMALRRGPGGRRPGGPGGPGGPRGRGPGGPRGDGEGPPVRPERP